VVGSRLASSATRQARHARAQQEVRDALGEERYLALCHAGARYALADIVRFAAEGFDELPPHPNHQPPAAPPAALPAVGLTSREWEIAGLVAEGLSNREVAGGWSSPSAPWTRTSSTSTASSASPRESRWPAGSGPGRLSE
jgi:ATP/maltotriose-dependent transcriptional regulator MalT